MTPHVIDIDERGGAEKRPHGADRNFVCLTMIVSELVSCCNQSTKGAAPHCPAVSRAHRMGIDVSRELAAAPVLLIFYKRPSLLDDLNLEWFRHDNSLFLQIPFAILFLR